MGKKHSFRIKDDYVSQKVDELLQDEDGETLTDKWNSFLETLVTQLYGSKSPESPESPKSYRAFAKLKQPPIKKRIVTDGKITRVYCQRENRWYPITYNLNQCQECTSYPECRREVFEYLKVSP